MCKFWRPPFSGGPRPMAPMALIDKKALVTTTTTVTTTITTTTVTTTTKTTITTTGFKLCKYYS